MTSRPLIASVTTALIVAAMATGCGGGVRPRPGEWDSDTSPLGEGYDVPHKEDNGATVGKDETTRTDARAGDRQEPAGTDATGHDDPTEGTATGTGDRNANKPTMPRTANGIWVKTHVKATLQDEAGDKMISDYETEYDENGNALSTEVTSDDWTGSISYLFDANGYRTECSMTGDDDLWLPEFEVGFLSLLDEGKATLSNAVDPDGTLMTTSVTNDGTGLLVSYQYDRNGNLSKMTASDGHVEEYGTDGLVSTIAEYDPDDPTESEAIEYGYTRDHEGNPTQATLTMTSSEDGETSKEEAGRVSYETDESGNISRMTVTDVEDEFGYRLDVRYEYEWIPNPSPGARLYARTDRYGAFY